MGRGAHRAGFIEGVSQPVQGHIRNVQFRNIRVIGGLLPFSILHGFDEDHLVEDITFENITFHGTRLRTPEELKLYRKYAERIKIQ